MGKIIKSQSSRNGERKVLKNLISSESRFFQVFHLSTVNSFPLAQNFSAERKHCTGTHRNSIGRIHNGVRLCAVRPLPLEFPRESCGPLGDSFLPRDFLALESFGGRYISRNCKKQRENKEARQKFWKKGRRTLCARLFC